MSVFKIDLAGFEFPKDLPNDKANFRFVVDLRYTNEKGQFTTEHAVMPSLDTFWECDRSRSDKPNYVRKDESESSPGKFDMNPNRIDAWDKLVLLVNGQSVHSIQFKVFDVNRRDAWDKVKDFLRGAVEAVIGKLKGPIPADLPVGLSESLGGAADDVQSFLLKKLAGGDNLLFRGSTVFPEPTNGSQAPGLYSFEGLGTKGTYKINFALGVGSADGKATASQKQDSSGS